MRIVEFQLDLKHQAPAESPVERVSPCLRELREDYTGSGSLKAVAFEPMFLTGGEDRPRRLTLFPRDPNLIPTGGAILDIG